MRKYSVNTLPYMVNVEVTMGYNLGCVMYPVPNAFDIMNRKSATMKSDTFELVIKQIEGEEKFL